MDIGDSPEETAFRAEARAFLEQHAERKTPGVTSADELNRHDPNWMYDHLQRCREWQHVLYDNGWAGITWPKEFGGRGGLRTRRQHRAQPCEQFHGAEVVDRDQHRRRPIGQAGEARAGHEPVECAVTQRDDARDRVVPPVGVAEIGLDLRVVQVDADHAVPAPGEPRRRRRADA